MTNETVIFLHSPRSGGTTLNSILRYQYGSNALHSFRNGFSSDSIDSYFDLTHSEQKKIKCFRGHINFGLHEYVSKNCTYITILRNPVERVLSLFGYISGIRGINLLKSKAYSKLEKFLNEGHTGYVYNDQVRRIAGKTRDQSTNIDDIEIAKHNLNRYFIVVGITESFDQSILLMEQLLNWEKRPWYIKNNYHGSGSAVTDIPNELIDQIKDQNELDLELYNYALARLNKQVKENNISKQKLNRFQFVNENLVSKIAPPIISVIRQLRQ